MIELLLELLAQLRVLHWQTKVYSQHVAYGELYESLDSKIDMLIETHMGMLEGDYTINETELNIYDIRSIDTTVYLNSFISTLNEIKERNIQHTNIVDDMVDDINKTKYLLKLK